MKPRETLELVIVILLVCICLWGFSYATTKIMVQIMKPKLENMVDNAIAKVVHDAIINALEYQGNLENK